MRWMSPAVPLALRLIACAPEGARTARTSDSVDADSAVAISLPTGEGRLTVTGGSIWYRISGTGTGTPVVLLHGGPGYSSFYLKPLEALGNDRPVVRYDQLGAGKSERVTDTTLFTIARFVDELERLRAHLGYETMHLLGHSWGTILAVEYYRAHPEHVTSLVLGSPALDIPTWEKNARVLAKTLSDSAQRAIAAHEKDGNFAAPDYQAANEEFFGRYVVRHPLQPDFDSVMTTINEAIYTFMQGPSEFTITGTLKTYDATDFLARIKVPVLYTVGEFDEADVPTVRHFAQLTPGAKVAVIDGAAHITMWDNAPQNIAVVRDFLRAVDARATH
jgi:proline iminopeptidase